MPSVWASVWLIACGILILISSGYALRGLWRGLFNGVKYMENQPIAGL